MTAGTRELNALCFCRLGRIGPQKLLERIFDKDSFSADATDILRLAERLERAHPPNADS